MEISSWIADGAARNPGKVAIRFADTMSMSSYLVAFVVGPLEATDWVDVKVCAVDDVWSGLKLVIRKAAR